MTRQVIEEDIKKNPNFYIWAPVGRFCWKGGDMWIVRQTEQRQDGSLPPNVSAVLQAGFFESGDGTRTDKYLNLRAALGTFIQLVRSKWGIFF
jgi:hypothetical protein